MTFLCVDFWAHDWGKWETYSWHGTYHTTNLHDERVSTPCSELRQKRACKRCGFAQDKLIRKGG